MPAGTSVGEHVGDAGRAPRRARQAGLQDRRDGQAPPRPALRRHRADHGDRRPADRDEGGRGAGRRHHRRSRRSPTSGVRAPMSRPRSTGRWTSRPSACRRAPSASTWAKVDPGDRDLDVSLDMPDEMRPRGPMTIPVSVEQSRRRRARPTSRSPRSTSASSTSPTSSRRRRTTGISASASSAWRSATSTAS